MTDAGILLDEVAVRYTARAGRIEALDRVSLSVPPAVCVAVVGRSGAGKSTALRCLAGLLPPDQGAVRWFGRDVARLPRAPRRQLHRRVQLLVQNPQAGFDPRWDVRAVLTEPFRYQGGGSVTDGELGRLAMMVGLDPAVLSRRHQSLSGGEQQRLALARALAAGPAFLLCDEPTASLDASGQAELVKLLARLRTDTGAGIVLVTHDLALVPLVADRVVVLDDGRVVERLSIEQLHAARHPVTRELIDALPVPHWPPPSGNGDR